MAIFIIISVLFIVLLIAFIGAIINTGCFIADWKYRRRGAKIKFSAFQKFYSINPDRWEIDDRFNVHCQTLEWGYEIFHFGPLDTFKYQCWLDGLEKDREAAADAQSISDMIKAVKSDIEKTKHRAKWYQDEAKDYMKRWDDAVG